MSDWYERHRADVETVVAEVVTELKRIDPPIQSLTPAEYASYAARSAVQHRSDGLVRAALLRCAAWALYGVVEVDARAKGHPS